MTLRNDAIAEYQLLKAAKEAELAAAQAALKARAIASFKEVTTVTTQVGSWDPVATGCARIMVEGLQFSYRDTTPLELVVIGRATNEEYAIGSLADLGRVIIENPQDFP